ncbi:vitelline envelope sperm lysin receptor-like [Liolophura sinensis]|uniref:vitelline envelope sperm lysin receptor-like n=1 Tax=Liolophura sinensis TaxID=3198878 RepID=UPI003159775F
MTQSLPPVRSLRVQDQLILACSPDKKDGSNTYTVDVEVGWGDRGSQVLQQSEIRTLSCAYDDHGQAVSSEQNITDWFLNPWESQTLLGGNSSAAFVLKVMDVLGEEVTSDYISLGRKIRLMAEDSSGKAVAFRALSCSALNSVSRYHILRAGCGDGLVFSKTAGFKTEGNKVYSPFFEAFKLAGADYSVNFQCRFTECSRFMFRDSQWKKTKENAQRYAAATGSSC